MKKEFIHERTYEINVTIEIVKRTNGKYYAEIARNAEENLWNENDEIECWINEDGQLKAQVCCTEQEYDSIIELFEQYVATNGVKYARKCTECGNGMNEGYIIGNGDEYFCSDKCLHKVYTPEEWELMADDEDTDEAFNYWTEWESEEDFQFVLFNNHLIEF